MAAHEPAPAESPWGPPGLAEARVALRRGHLADAHLADADDPRARLVAALRAAWTGQAAQAATDATHAVADLRDPSDADALDLAEVLLAAGQPRTARALAEARAAGPLGLEARRLVALTWLVEGDTTRTVHTLKGLLADARARRDIAVEAAALALLGRALLDRHAYPAARAALDTAGKLAVAAGDRRVQAAVLGGLGLCRVGAPDTAGAHAEGTSLLARACHACAELDDPAAESAWRSHLDHALAELGRAAARAEAMDAWIAVEARLGRTHLVASLRERQGDVWHELAEPGRARAAWDAAAVAWATAGAPEDAARAARKAASA